MVVVANAGNDVVDELEGKRDDDDDDERLARVGGNVAPDVPPKEIGAVAVVVRPNGVVVDEPPPNVNEELAVLGPEATVFAGVEPNDNVEGCVEELALGAPKENADG